MNDIDELIKVAQKARDSLIERYNKRIALLERYREVLAELPKFNDYTTDELDFDYLCHSDIVKVMLAFPGKWAKTPNENGSSIDYTHTTVDGDIICCWAGEPPPSCKIIEELKVVPGHWEPETVKKVRKIQCPQNPFDAVRPDGEAVSSPSETGEPANNVSPTALEDAVANAECPPQQA